MNIGIFTETYYPQINGVVTSIRTLEKELNNLGHKVYIFATTHPDATPKPRVFRTPSMPFWSMPSHRVAFSFSPKVLKTIKNLNLDIIHTQTEFPLGLLGKTAAKIFNIPMIHTYHTMYEDYVHYILKGHVVTPKMAKDFSRIFCNSAEAVIAPTQKVYDVLHQYGVTRDIEIIPTGIELAPFKQSSSTDEDVKLLRETYNLNNTPVVLYLGRLAKEKSIDVIIKGMNELLKKLPTAKLLIVGDGPIRSNLEKLVTELNIADSVIFAGQQAWKDVPKFYHLADVFVNASTTETQGLTYAEAMAAQLPVVVKQDENIKGLLKDDVNGRIFVEDFELPNLLYEILTNKEKANLLTTQAFKDIEPFSSEKFGKDVVNLYEKVIEIHKLKKPHYAIPNLRLKERFKNPLIVFKPIQIKAMNNLKKIKDISIKRTFNSKK